MIQKQRSIGELEATSLLLRDILKEQSKDQKLDIMDKTGFGELGTGAPEVVKPIPMPLCLSKRAYGDLLEKPSPRAQPKKLDGDMRSYAAEHLWKVHSNKIRDNNMLGIGNVMTEPTYGRMNTRQMPKP